MDAPSYLPFLVYAGGVLLVVGGMLLLSHLLGERHRDRRTAEPYESGIPPTGAEGLRVPVKFFLIGILFVIFDLELAFLFAWASSVRELGWEGFWGAFVFLVILGVALVYEWRIGALDWSRSAQPRRPRMPGKPGPGQTSEPPESAASST